ncbi:unnamed protein product [Gadus morhua 'NCC']
MKRPGDPGGWSGLLGERGGFWEDLQGNGAGSKTSWHERGMLPWQEVMSQAQPPEVRTEAGWVWRLFSSLGLRVSSIYSGPGNM